MGLHSFYVGGRRQELLEEADEVPLRSVDGRLMPLLSPNDIQENGYARYCALCVVGEYICIKG